MLKELIIYLERMYNLIFCDFNPLKLNYLWGWEIEGGKGKIISVTIIHLVKLSVGRIQESGALWVVLIVWHLTLTVALMS